MYWHCADLWFAITQKMLFSKWTVVYFGHCNLLNSRQFSFINQAESGVKSYKGQFKLTLFRDCKPSWILIKMLLISRRWKLPLHMNYNTPQELTFSFVERLIASNLQYIWFFSCWFVHSTKSQKLEAAFTFWYFKPNIMIKCRVECQSLKNPKSQELQSNSVQCDWQLKIQSFLK